MNLLQGLFINIFNPIYSLTGKIGEKARNVILQIICFCFPIYFLIYYAWIFSDHGLSLTDVQILGSVLILALVIFSINKPLEKVEWNKLLFWLMEIAGLSMLAISFIHPIGSGYRVFALMLIFVFPCLYFVWNNRGDYGALFDKLTIAIAICASIYFLVSVYWAFNGSLLLIGGRVNGHLRDSNLYSMVGMSGFNATLYLLVSKHREKIQYVILLISIVFDTGILFMGQSRISILVCFINVLVAAFFFARYCRWHSVKKTIFRYLTFVIAIVLGILLASAVMNLQNTMLISQINTQNEEVIQNQESTESVETSPSNSSAVERFIPAENADANQYTAGRVYIWQCYAQYLNVLGNDFSKANDNIFTQINVHHAHNNFLEYSFRFGVPVGILMILLELFAGIIALIYLFKNSKKSSYLIFSIIFMVQFTLESLFDIATIPFERESALYFFILLLPMMDKNLFEKEEKNEIQ